MLSGRDACKAELVKCAEEDSTIICIEADLGGRDHPFLRRFPERFYNLGIAEMAALDICTGFAEAGFKPFFTTFAPFVALRCAESLKLSMGYMGKAITVIGSYGGVCGGWFGTTHHCLEDVGVVRLFPGIKIACPYGEAETRQVLREAAQATQPFYIRLGRNDRYPDLIQSSEFASLAMEQGYERRYQVTLVSIGEKATQLCVAAKQQLGEVNHLHLCYVDNLSLAKVIEQMTQLPGLFIVAEEHRRTGSIAAELALSLPHRSIHSFTPSDDWPKFAGSQDDILTYLGFSLNTFVSFIKNIIYKKEHL
ncbi:transketolase [Prodigiosinella confusarubida]|uniref:Transketolase n=1 Tax=Serratia sp. (strain ATCC 39006) TaxID=104623 RepID=A0A2I5TIB1_SERS3|nr:transketolase [Serratia sp. ATCC 39006]AUG99983.1 transketolase [Serratia sp. ATCC 39006]AUH04303.1 transketolase [Serratia sp. ATCC 39006]